MISEQTRNSYSEVYNLLKIMDKQEVMRIPIEILETIRKNRNMEYVPTVIDENANIVISKKALAVYLSLYIDYIEQNEDKKRELINKLNKNEGNKELKYNINIFEKNNTNNNVSTQMVEYKMSFFRRLINSVKRFFKINN